MDGGKHLQLMALRPINDRWGSRLGSSRERSPLGSGRAQGLAVRYPIAKARGLDPYSVPGCPGAGLSEPPFPIL